MWQTLRVRCSHTIGIDVIKLKHLQVLLELTLFTLSPCGPFDGNGKWSKVARSDSDCQSFQLRTSKRATDRISVISALKRTALPLHLICHSMTSITSNEEYRKIVSLIYPHKKTFCLRAKRKKKSSGCWEMMAHHLTPAV